MSSTPSDAQQHDQPLSARSRVAASLRRDITSLRFEPGEGISDKEIALELGTSRTPVREALILLEEEGLIEVYPRIGTFVTLVDLQRIRDAQFLREAVETSSALDFPDSSPAFSMLRTLLSQQAEAAEESDAEGFFELDETFHRTLLEQAGHGAAWKTVNAAKAHLDRARRLTMERSTSLPELVAQHRAVVDALESDDRAGAADQLRDHLRGIYEDIDVVRRQRPELFSDLADPQAGRRITKRLQNS